MTSAARSRPGRAPRAVPRPALLPAAGRLAPLPLAAAARGAVALAAPLLAGVVTGHVAPAVLAAIGALWGVSQDGADPYRTRLRRLGALGLSSAVGLLAGELALRSGQPAALTVCLVLAALVSGAVSLRGRVSSVTGLHLLLGTTIGGGIPAPGPWWQAPLALFSGVALVAALSATPWLWRRHHIERNAVLAAYRAASAALGAAGTPGAEAARRRLTGALDHAQQVLRRAPARDGRAAGERRALLGALHTAVRLGEVTSALVWEARPLPAAAVRVPLDLAARLVPGPAAGTPVSDITRGTAALPPREPVPADSPAPYAPGPRPVGAAVPGTGDSPGLRALAALAAHAGRPDDASSALHPPAAAGHSRADRLRYAVLLAVCVLAGQLCALALHGPRGYWLPMTVAFVYKPDFGPVLRRALHRCAGTVVGVAAIGAVTLLTQDTYALIGAVAAFGALMAVGVRHHYALATLGLTAIVFVLVDLLGDHRALYGARILDTALAAGIVLVAHFALWPGAAGGRAAARTEAALAAAHRYRDLAPTAAPAQRHALRRAAYQQLAEARRAVAHARSEPGLPGHDRERAITAAERLCDAVSARSLAAVRRPGALTGAAAAAP
ncbi:FUSC family protein [Streptomyces tropicalis]|uniref:FUSC family protein n=1 Tax=Streptomyces tropicalis TaxID=3034234 RepID=A0ABT6A373_9ACTN|nr:FUSC family protein [Streptomyces tropicalis]MDF3299093.1 FUSC family protein [Streptomyces tropicalis]